MERLKGSRKRELRKQHPIDPYVVDFYCAAARLIVEVTVKCIYWVTDPNATT